MLYENAASYNLGVVQFRNCPSEDSNFKIFHTFDCYCKNMTTTSFTAIDGIQYHVMLIVGSAIAKFRIHQMLYSVNSPNINLAKK